ncbi:thiosulfate sulfurtransferase/rhodanese-like domain-containing protein 3 [Megalops cyprinoides]|uniref:thiosulfate sulfurtransferase/rhodanese-like domain-containing protein 3 n=1 Tax=Megalops cyprinoides TaxID=118141 RepID=UPI001864C27A|nr:thiosulfate sulfurtransferase/rhodanese-like domain-containing protein 3 [Megalops cyprinoides]
MTLNGCSRLIRILPRILSSRNLLTLAYASRGSLSPSPCNSHSVVLYSRVTFTNNLLRGYCSGSDTDINVSHEQLKKVLATKSGVVIDVREPWELREYGNIPGSINVPLGQVNQALQLDPQEFRERYGGDMPSTTNNIVFSCLAGVRSKKALDTAVSLGYSNVQHYPGGWEEWAKNEILQTKR